jgi:hypothetical protein
MPRPRRVSGFPIVFRIMLRSDTLTPAELAGEALAAAGLSQVR